MIQISASVIWYSVFFRLNRTYRPSGSYARGRGRLDSDLDLLVIGDFRASPYLRARELQELLARFPIRIDLHLVTPQELAIESQKPYGFLSSVQRNSVSLYQKSEKKS